jgi:hypothetical protein
MYTFGYVLTQKCNKIPYWNKYIKQLFIKQFLLIFTALNAFIHGMALNNKNNEDGTNILFKIHDTIKEDLKIIDSLYDVEDILDTTTDSVETHETIETMDTVNLNNINIIQEKIKKQYLEVKKLLNNTPFSSQQNKVFKVTSKTILPNNCDDLDSKNFGMLQREQTKKYRDFIEKNFNNFKLEKVISDNNLEVNDNIKLEINTVNDKKNEDITDDDNVDNNFKEDTTNSLKENTNKSSEDQPRGSQHVGTYCTSIEYKLLLDNNLDKNVNKDDYNSLEKKTEGSLEEDIDNNLVWGTNFQSINPSQEEAIDNGLDNYFGDEIVDGLKDIVDDNNVDYYFENNKELEKNEDIIDDDNVDNNLEEDYDNGFEDNKEFEKNEDITDNDNGDNNLDVDINSEDNKELEKNKNITDDDNVDNNLEDNKELEKNKNITDNNNVDNNLKENIDNNLEEYANNSLEEDGIISECDIGTHNLENSINNVLQPNTVKNDDVDDSMSLENHCVEFDDFFLKKKDGNMTNDHLSDKLFSKEIDEPNIDSETIKPIKKILIGKKTSRYCKNKGKNKSRCNTPHKVFKVTKVGPKDSKKDADEPIKVIRVGKKIL